MLNLHLCIVASSADGFTSSFPICISFSSLITLARTSKTVLNNSGKSGHSCLVPDVRGSTFGFFTIENDVCYGFLVSGLFLY